MQLFKIVLILALVLAKNSIAQVEENSGEIDVFAKVCENLSSSESRASARLRATDKASFKAVEEIPELREFRQYLDPHQFNLHIYKLIDNYFEDMAINVLSQDNEKVCVEVSGYIRTSSINEVFSDITDIQDGNTTLVVETENVEENVNIVIPPKPEINISKEIAYDYSDDEIVEEYIIEDENITPPIPTLPKAEKNNGVSVFIDRTMFYNDTSTNGFFAHLEQELLKAGKLNIQAKFDNPKYILRTKVLKAKVDNINSETGRLQIVVSVELTDTSNSETTTEHQNRFILFNTSEDAQAKAAELTKNLLADGVAKILPQIKKANDILLKNNIITPPSK
ncbi:MAG: hypothetical protein E7004_02990 [Alphaproteobacteria bacterium]|nr:hypothetical protein [Alphaproteobacteria bacterium]